MSKTFQDIMRATGARKFAKPDEEDSAAPAISGNPTFKTAIQLAANRRFVTGPANATQTISRFGFLRLLKLTGTGFA